MAVLIFFAFLGALLCPKEACSAEPCLECHKQLTQGRVKHQAVDMGCDVCHAAPHTGKSPELSLKAAMPDLCFGCHDAGMTKKKSPHVPALAGKCTDCHNPHSSRNEKLLVAELPGLCYKCHDEEMFKRRVVHSPVASGMCTFCHDPHASDAQRMVLTSDTPGLCFVCHDKGGFLTAKYIHSPVMTGNCTLCHDPHSQKMDRLLVSEPRTLCFACHEKSMVSGKYTHSPVARDMCGECHSVHQSEKEKLLVDSEPALCYRCHDKDLFVGGLVAGDNVHAPVASGLCSACHTTHASGVKHMLKKHTPDLCYDCHLEDKMQGKKQHGPFKIGMCNACHDPHRGTAPKLLIKGTPELCFLCHSEKGFVRREVHKPVMEGRCFVCHNSHTSNYGYLLKEEGDLACKGCHPGVSEGFHPKTGFDRPEKLDAKQRMQYKLFGDKPWVLSHPTGGKDPKRPGRRFGCSSCHDPHSSDWDYAFRYEAPKPMDLCLNCHAENNKKGRKNKK